MASSFSSLGYSPKQFAKFLEKLGFTDTQIKTLEQDQQVNLLKLIDYVHRHAHENPLLVKQKLLLAGWKKADIECAFNLSTQTHHVALEELSRKINKNIALVDEKLHTFKKPQSNLRAKLSHHFFSESSKKPVMQEDVVPLSQVDDVPVVAPAQMSSVSVVPPIPFESDVVNKPIVPIIENTEQVRSPIAFDSRHTTVVQSGFSQPGALGYYNPLKGDDYEYVEADADRVKTGIPDLDKAIAGGFPRASSILVSGGAGTGKSTLGMQFLVKGIVEYNEPGAYITFEQSRDAVVALAHLFKWDIEKFEQEGKLVIHEYTPEQIQKALEAGGGSFRDMIESIGAKRLVVDSITEYIALFGSPTTQRRQMTDLFKTFSKWGLTTVVVGEEESSLEAHHSTVLDYETDGVILLYNERKGDLRYRSLEIFKMRGTKHAGRVFPMKITNAGVFVDVSQKQTLGVRYA